MLETILQIGKAFRNSDKNLKYHRYIKKCPEDTDKLKILRLSIPVKEDFSFDLNSISEIKDENVIKNDLYYLTFKTSDADGLVKYIFGDIYYSAWGGNPIETDKAMFALWNGNFGELSASFLLTRRGTVVIPLVIYNSETFPNKQKLLRYNSKSLRIKNHIVFPVFF